MNLRHAVITVVNRDDLPDSGADHYKQCIDAVAQTALRSPSNCSVPTSQATSTPWPICSSRVLCQCLLTRRMRPSP